MYRCITLYRCIAIHTICIRCIDRMYIDNAQGRRTLHKPDTSAQSGICRRMGGAVAFGVDRHEQPSYAIRFGSEVFHLGDALDRNLLRGLVRRFRPTGIFASPPCQGSSTATFGKAPSSAPHLISQTRDLLGSSSEYRSSSRTCAVPHVR